MRDSRRDKPIDGLDEEDPELVYCIKTERGAYDDPFG